MASIALLEVGHFAPALIVADRCVKAAGVRLLGIENTDAGTLCIKLEGRTSDVTEAAHRGADLARKMGTSVSLSILPGPTEETIGVITSPPVYSGLLSNYDALIPHEETMNGAYHAIGLIETQGLVALLHATDVMLKTSDVRIVGKEKIGGGYVTLMIHGDLAAVQAAVEAGKNMIEKLGAKLIIADIISNPHPDLTALLPTG